MIDKKIRFALFCVVNFSPVLLTLGRHVNKKISRYQCCGSGMFIPDPTFFHPGSELSPSRIPDPGSSSKNLSILTPKKAKKNGF
jgi:hypothetical protein